MIDSPDLQTRDLASLPLEKRKQEINLERDRLALERTKIDRKNFLLSLEEWDVRIFEIEEKIRKKEAEMILYSELIKKAGLEELPSIQDDLKKAKLEVENGF